VAHVLNGQTKAPLVLFLNFGWLASDDARNQLDHRTTDLGQAAVRLAHWTALIKANTNEEGPFVFRIAIREASVAKNGVLNLEFRIYPIGRAAEMIKDAYEKYGIHLSKDRVSVVLRVYEIIKALREAAVELREVRRGGLSWLELGRVKDVDA